MRNIGKPSGLQLKGAKTDAEAGHDSGTGTLGRVQARALQLGDVIVACALGRGGCRLRKREGDGATPMGRWRLREVLYRADRLPRPRTRLPARAVRPDMVGAMRWATATTIAWSGIPTRPAPRSFGGAILFMT